MNHLGCPQGKFCTSGMQNVTEAINCPAGRLCPKATAVGSKDQISSCNSDDPNFCYIGEICQKGYFCPIGTSDLTLKNSCYELDTFPGARERFFCTRTTDSIY